MSVPNEFDKETLRLMVMYFGGDPRIPRTVQKEVLCLDSGYENSTLAAFTDLIASAIALIPPDYRDSAIVRMEGDEWIRLTITYSRPETADDVARNVQRAYDYAKAKQDAERITYERLKRKFEEPGQ